MAAADESVSLTKSRFSHLKYTTSPLKQQTVRRPLAPQAARSWWRMAGETARWSFGP